MVTTQDWVIHTEVRGGRQVFRVQADTEAEARRLAFDLSTMAARERLITVTSAEPVPMLEEEPDGAAP